MYLRDYQNDGVYEFLRRVESHKGIPVRGVIQLPTGSGKTVMMADLCERIQAMATFQPILILVHREELVYQTVEKLEAFCDTESIGRIHASVNETHCKIIVAMVQTLQRDARLGQYLESLNGIEPLIIVDECHHGGADSYRGIISAFPRSHILGFTATYASDNHDLDDIFTDGIIFKRDILDMINDGWLVDVRGRLLTIDDFSLEEVRKSKGDFLGSSLSDLLLSADAQTATAEQWKELASDRPTVVFVPSVEAVHAYTEAFANVGATAAPVWGDMLKSDRAETMDAARRGLINVIVNCGVLTEGTDIPPLSCAVIARPTMSPVLYTQMVGRILRPSPGKTDALVLDISGASQYHSLAALPVLTSSRLKSVEPGESLMEAVRREKSDQLPIWNDYEITSRAIDLMEKSGTRWLETHKGVWFIQVTKDDFVFVWPGNIPGSFSVGIRSRVSRKDATPGKWLIQDVSFSTAQGVAEEYAQEVAPDPGYLYGRHQYMPASRAKARNYKTASENAVAYARSLKLKVPDNVGAGTLTDMIDVHLVSRILDKAL